MSTEMQEQQPTEDDNDDSIKQPSASSTPASLIINKRRIAKWSIDTCGKWLTSIGYEDCITYFREHKINGRALLMLNEDDLKEVIKHNVGQRKNLYHLIRVLQIRYNRYINNQATSSMSFFSEGGTVYDDASSVNSSNDVTTTTTEEEELLSQQSDDSPSKDKNNNLSSNKKNHGSGEEIRTPIRRHRRHRPAREHLDSDETRVNNEYFLLKQDGVQVVEDEIYFDANTANICANCLKKYNPNPYQATNSSSSVPHNASAESLKSEKRKTFISFVYLFVCSLWSTFMLTVVHDRVPDIDRYPPLPDIVLDNVPLIPWAFFATEIIGLVLIIIMFAILLLHKYRSIIFRRMCSLGGTIFFLRSFTMLMTSLSVPGVHIQCSTQRYGNLINKLKGALGILAGGGLYLHGVRTCGDYMFSGHTVWLTLLTHFITEYTPTSLSMLHISVWILNMFGLFFILGAHEHYSIDVFVAFYISSRLFLYYHSLANNKVLFQRDHRRVRVWFPLFSFFEANIHAIVPNEYESPLTVFAGYYKRLFRVRAWRKLFRTATVSSNLNQSATTGNSPSSVSFKSTKSKSN